MIIDKDALTRKLKDWARTFRGVNSPDVADLLDKAATAIEAGHHDHALALELLVCAQAREHLPEQQAVAFHMCNAATWLTSKPEDGA